MKGNTQGRDILPPAVPEAVAEAPATAAPATPLTIFSLPLGEATTPPPRNLVGIYQRVVSSWLAFEPANINPQSRSANKHFKLGKRAREELVEGGPDKKSDEGATGRRAPLRGRG